METACYGRRETERDAVTRMTTLTIVPREKGWFDDHGNVMYFLPGTGGSTQANIR